MRTVLKRLNTRTLQCNRRVLSQSSFELLKRYASTIKVKELDDPDDLPSSTTLLFELNGTLLKTSDTIARALETLMKENGISSPIKRDASALTVGESFKALVQGTLKIQIDETNKFQDPKFIAAQTIRFNEIFRAASLEGSITLQPNVHETLTELAEEGHLLVVCTNFPQKIADELVDRFELRRYFTLVAGGDLIPVCKPDPGHLLYSVECSGRDISGAIMIGSTVIDIKAAKAANIPVIALPSDALSKELIMNFSPEMVIEEISDIPDAMERLMENSMY